jgi:O-antigen ligase
VSGVAAEADRSTGRERGGALLERGDWERIGLVALVLLAPAAIAYLSFNAGGYFPNATGFAAVVFAQALILRTTLAGRPFEGLTRGLAVPLWGLALFAAWQLASALWSHASAQTLDAFDRTLLYVLAFLLFGSIRVSAIRLRWLVRALLAGIAAVCVIGLVSRILPHTWPTAESFVVNRLNYPLTYWNAEGMLAVMGLILAFHLTAEREEHWSVRVLAAALIPALAATLLLTFSRGAIAAGVVGLLAYCLLTRPSTLPSALLASVPAAAIAVRSAYDATLLATTRATSGPAVAQGRHVAGVVLACVVGAGLLRALLLLLDRYVETLPIIRRPPPRAIRAGAGATLALAVLIVFLGLGGVGFVHRQYDKFIHTTKEGHTANTRERLGEVTNDGRLPLWEAALDIYRTQKLRGTGAGTYQQYYPRYRSEEAGGYVVDAHSLYLQTLAENGLVGLLLIVVVVIGMLAGLAARIRGPDRPLHAGIFAVVLAWAVHQGFDWDWQMPAVTLCVFMLAGLALARRPDGRAGLAGLPAGRTLTALGWLALAICPLLGALSYSHLQQGGLELTSGHWAGAREAALSSLSTSSKRPQAYEVIGVSDLEQGYAQAGEEAMEQAVGLEPESWEAQFLLADAQAASGADPHAAVARAQALDPLEEGLVSASEQFQGHNPRRWEASAPGLLAEALNSGLLTITNL